MVNYNNGKIYKIVCNTTGDIYIGSTTKDKVSQRLAQHVQEYKVSKKNKRTKTTSYSIIDNGNYDIYLVELFPCNSKDELTAREGEIIKEYNLNCKCINKVIEGRTKQQYRIDNKDTIKDREKKYKTDNKEKIKEQMKQYRIDNRDKIRKTYKIYKENNKETFKIHSEKAKDKFMCDCGGSYTRSHMQRHFTTSKHQNYLNENNYVVQT
jgi:hypothetical protein